MQPHRNRKWIQFNNAHGCMTTLMEYNMSGVLFLGELGVSPFSELCTKFTNIAKHGCNNDKKTIYRNRIVTGTEPEMNLVIWSTEVYQNKDTCCEKTTRNEAYSIRTRSSIFTISRFLYRDDYIACQPKMERAFYLPLGPDDKNYKGARLNDYWRR